MDFLKLGITPINEQNPSGEDVKYDEDFELLNAQISKLTSPSSSSGIDWDKVVTLSSIILETKSKDILVAVYFSYGLFKQHDIDGLADGVKVLADLLENYWETLYPPKRRLKGRINAIEWWIDKIVEKFETIDTIEVSDDKKTDLITNIKRIDNFLNNEIDDAPLFYNIIKLIDMKLVSKIQEVVQQETIPPKEEIVEKEVLEEKIDNKENNIIEDKKEVFVPKMDNQTVTVGQNIEKDFKNIVNTLSQITGQMIQTKDYRSELFIVNRAFGWLDIDQLPYSQKNITMLNPPDTQEIDLLSKLYSNKNYEALLWAAESRITTYLFWLDLHYYVAQSLKNLNHIVVADTIYTQVQYFIKKLPNLENLTFSDSTPFANKNTKKWLTQKKITKNKTISSDLVDNYSNIQEKESDCTLNGIDTLTMMMNKSASIEEKVLYNIKICRCLLNNNSTTLIDIYTKELLDTIEKYSTNQWNPKIALEAYIVSVECLQLIDKKINSELLTSLYTKIALLKPSLIDELNN